MILLDSIAIFASQSSGKRRRKGNSQTGKDYKKFGQTQRSKKGKRTKGVPENSKKAAEEGTAHIDEMLEFQSETEAQHGTEQGPTSRQLLLFRVFVFHVWCVVWQFIFVFHTRPLCGLNPRTPIISRARNFVASPGLHNSQYTALCSNCQLSVSQLVKR